MRKGDSSLGRLKGKSLLIFDDGLATRDGHWLDSDKTIAALHADLGVSTTVVCDRSFPHAKELEAMGVTVLPLVEFSPWKDLAAGKATNGPLRSLVLGWYFRGILTRLLRERSFDCVLHPAAMSSHVMAWCLMPRKVRRRSGRTVFATWISLARYEADGRPRFARRLLYWKLMGFLLRNHFKQGQFAFKTDSGRLAAEYSLLGNLPASEMPSPGLWSEAKPVVRDGDAPVCFGSVGPARIEKGIDIFQQAIEKVLDHELGQSLRFVIQWNRAVHDSSGAEMAPSPKLQSDPRVRFVTEALSSEDYQDLLFGIDCMVLPYRRYAYYARGSGVAVESACMGLPMIHTADTWLSDFVDQQGAGIAVPDGDATALAAAILHIAGHFAEYKDRAMVQSKVALSANSAEAYAGALWGIGG